MVLDGAIEGGGGGGWVAETPTKYSTSVVVESKIMVYSETIC